MKKYVSKQEFAKLLFSARKQLNREFTESIATCRCVPQIIKHKVWVYKLFNINSTWFAHCYDRSFNGIFDVYYYLDGTTWLETTNPCVSYV